MSALFDAYVMVDWSAAATPVSGPGGIWIAIAERGAPAPRLLNPRTRAQATAQLADALNDLLARGRRVLAGFDFAFGYPAGFAVVLNPREPDWRGVWKALAARLSDDDDNHNRRFEQAAAMNRDLFGRPFPFWGHPRSEEHPQLPATRPEGYGVNGAPAERRLTEDGVPGPQPVWKLAYTGSVGSQTLLGLPRLWQLRTHPWLAEAARVWPFETGLGVPPEEARLVLAEVYPSLLPAEPEAGECRDEAQVKALARWFANLDDVGRLPALFAGDPALAPEERAVVEREEGWILGVTRRQPAKRARRYDYLREPEAIYRASFAAIEAEADFSSLPKSLRPVAARLVHACGMPDVVADLAYAPEVALAARKALEDGAPVLVDAAMVDQGITRRLLPASNPVICTLHDPQVPALARRLNTTQSAAAVELWEPHLDGAVVAIGNAPTALFHLLESLEVWQARPAAILAFPVGFIGAAESKQALIEAAPAPYLTLRGRRGGSALAAAAVNALAGAMP